MKKKILAILVCMLVAICSTFTIAASTSVERQILVTQSNSSKQGGNTLITEYFGKRVIEVDIGGTIVWQKAGLNYSVDAERLANGNTLITELGNRVIEVNPGGTIVWQYTGGLFGPWDAERLANGNTLIADTYNHRIIEVNSSGIIVWQKTGLNLSTDAERLANGNTLIADLYNDRVIEVDSAGTIVWEKTGLNRPIDVERLGNGNTLITEFQFGQRVIEVDSGGNIVWVYSSSDLLWDAERLANGNTLIAEGLYYAQRVIEVDSGGTIVWQKAGLNFSVDAERVSNPPGAPSITGETSGKAGIEYEYTFNAVDSDGDDVKYFISWGDTNAEWTDFNASGTDVKIKHTWSEDGTYNITAKAQDIHGFEGPEGKLTVEIPRSRTVNRPLLLRLFERFPNIFPILRYILGSQ